MKTALKIVSIVGLLLWMACCYLGLFFATDGNYPITICVTLLIGVVLFLSYLLMLKMQDKGATQGNRDRARTTGFVMLGVYIVASLVSAFYINHFVKTFDMKGTIQKGAKAAINELDMTFDPNDVNPLPNSYRQWILDKSQGYKTSLKNNGFNGSISTEVEAFENMLLGTEDEGYINLETIVLDNLNKIEKSIDGWNFFTVVDRLHDLQNKKAWENQVVEYSKAHEYTKVEPFKPVQEHPCPPLEELTHASFIPVSFPAILIILALQLVILLGYLLGIKTGGGRDKIVTSDTGSIRSWSNTK